MTSRLGLGITAAVILILLSCSGLVGLFGGAASGECNGPSTVSGPPKERRSGSSAVAPIGRWSTEQVGRAVVIVEVGRQLRVPARGWVIALATAMQESSLTNPVGGDRDSIGLFQQRPSQGWGTPAQLRDPRYAARKFYATLLEVSGWQTMPLTRAAQQVQRSAYPDAYAKWEPDAEQLVGALTGESFSRAGCGIAISVVGWAHPAPGAVIGSGFRTSERLGHDGVDLIAARGTVIRAAAAGTVSRVRCNAVDVRTGADWGCDRDGDPELTSGCGWYVDIDHQGFVTRYCHMLTHPYVQIGLVVEPGDVIGVVGSSGHSSGPHLHYEVHRGADHSSASAIDPVAHMRSVGVPLG